MYWRAGEDFVEIQPVSYRNMSLEIALAKRYT